MSQRAGTTWTGIVVTRDSTGALSAATVGPVGTLYVNGVANAAPVTIAGANPYSWSVNLPTTLVLMDEIAMYVTATIGGVVTACVVKEDVIELASYGERCVRIINP